MNTLPALSVANVAVRQHDGLYSLNDLHKASGGATKHQPYEFVRLDQTQALIAELSKSGDSRNYIQTKRGKHNGGTFACRELVIAYAAWISPAFHLQVIRVFLDSVAPQPALPSPSYAVLPGQTLSAEQANTLREMMVKGCETVGKHKPGLFMMQGWAKLKAHFKVSYREIPTSQFAEAASLIARHIADWYNGIEDNDPPLQTYHRIRAELFDELLKGANVILNMRKEADRLRALAYGGGSDFMCGLALAMEEAGMHKTAERVRCLNDEQMKAYNAQIIALQSL